MIYFVALLITSVPALLILALFIFRATSSETNTPDPTPYVIQKEWSNQQAKYHYVLYHYTAWEDGWGIYVGYKPLGSGNKAWALKQKEHYGI